MKKFIPTLVFALVATSLVAGGYYLVKNFLKDRQSAMLTTQPAPPSTQAARATESGTTDFTGAPVTKTASGVAGPTVDAAQAGQAAIQRQLKTLEDINAVNEMNRRLTEQQRQMQKQR